LVNYNLVVQPQPHKMKQKDFLGTFHTESFCIGRITIYLLKM